MAGGEMRAQIDDTAIHSILYAQVNNLPPWLREFAGLDVTPSVQASSITR